MTSALVLCPRTPLCCSRALQNSATLLIRHSSSRNAHASSSPSTSTSTSESRKSCRISGGLKGRRIPRHQESSGSWTAAAGGGEMAGVMADPVRKQMMEKMQAVVNADLKGGWDKVWKMNTTPWDLGGVTPAVAALLEAGAVPTDAKTVLVPGCGTGYDVIAFAEGGKRTATGLDISETALSRAKEMAAGKPGSESTKFLNADFFTFTPEQPFDVIFDYTFFCAIDPSMRQNWAEKTASLLAPSGTLFTLAFPIGDHEGGPPHAVSKKAYEDVLVPLGLVCEELPTVSHPSRQGKEKLLVWSRSQSGSKI